MSPSSTESPEEIELRARAQRLEAVQDLGDEFGWRNLALVGWAILAVIALFDVAAFALFGQAYLAWYVANGALLSLGVPVLSAVGIDLDQRYGLISAHPLYFLSAWVSTAANWTNIWEPTGAPALYLGRTRWVAFDRLVSAVLSVLLGVALFVWFLVTAPPQYLLNIVCGAPARSALGSGKVVWDRLDLAFEKGPDGSVTKNVWTQDTTVSGASDPKPYAAAHRLGFDVKPVSVTYALAALVLFLAAVLPTRS